MNSGPSLLQALTLSKSVSQLHLSSKYFSANPTAVSHEAVFVSHGYTALVFYRSIPWHRLCLTTN